MQTSHQKQWKEKKTAKKWSKWINFLFRFECERFGSIECAHLKIILHINSNIGFCLRVKRERGKKCGVWKVNEKTEDSGEKKIFPFIL